MSYTGWTDHIWAAPVWRFCNTEVVKYTAWRGLVGTFMVSQATQSFCLEEQIEMIYLRGCHSS